MKRIVKNLHKKYKFIVIFFYHNSVLDPCQLSIINLSLIHELWLMPADGPKLTDGSITHSWVLIILLVIWHYLYIFFIFYSYIL